MAISDEQILAQNPWWTSAGWRASDPHLALLEEQPARLAADFVAGLDLSRPGIHTLRGPRQVGKSTDLKLLVERALDSGVPARAIVYLALDLLEGQHLSSWLPPCSGRSTSPMGRSPDTDARPVAARRGDRGDGVGRRP